MAYKFRSLYCSPPISVEFIGSPFSFSAFLQKSQHAVLITGRIQPNCAFLKNAILSICLMRSVLQAPHMLLPGVSLYLSLMFSSRSSNKQVAPTLTLQSFLSEVQDCPLTYLGFQSPPGYGLQSGPDLEVVKTIQTFIFKKLSLFLRTACLRQISSLQR